MDAKTSTIYSGVLKSDQAWCLNHYLLTLQQIFGLNLDPVIGSDDNVNCTLLDSSQVRVAVLGCSPDKVEWF